jgi:UDP-glucose 4-epimerase
VKKILVTGGAGFIGSHLAAALLARGDQVTVVDDESTGNAANLQSLAGSPGLRYLKGSIGDESLVKATVEEADEVYHLAAAVGVALIAKQPLETIERNIGPVQLLIDQLIARTKAGEKVKLFLASTSEVYGKNPKPIFAEDDDLVFGSTTRPRWSYGASKAIDEFLALGAAREYGLPVVIGRFFNVVGPRQSGAYGMVLPRFVQAALAGRSLIVHDDGQQVRCFAHVADVISAVLALMSTDAALGRVYNIGSDEPVSILDLARRVIAYIGSNSAIEFQSYADAYDRDFEDVRRRVPDLSRLRGTIAYRPRFDLDGIIKEVAEYFQK